MHDLAKISVITDIQPIEGKDRIVLATVENYKSIVQKGEFRVGDPCIYVFYDSILPEKPEFEFLRKRCWSEKYKGFRIKPMRMGNVISEGLVLPLSALPDGDKVVYPIGMVVTDLLGIRLYDPEIQEEKEPLRQKPKSKFGKLLFRFSWFRKLYYKMNKPYMTTYPDWISKSNEENIEAIYNKLLSSGDLERETWVVTEKVEGQAASYVYDGKKLHCFSHNFGVREGNWVEYANLINLKARLAACYKLIKKVKPSVSAVCIQGELIGPGIQKNIYKRKNLELYLYNGYTYHKGGTVYKFAWNVLNMVSDELGIPTVPLIAWGRHVTAPLLEDMLEDCQGNSELCPDVPREGLVWRNNDGSHHFKVKSRPYKIWWAGGDKE